MDASEIPVVYLRCLLKNLTGIFRPLRLSSKAATNSPGVLPRATSPVSPAGHEWEFGFQVREECGLMYTQGGNLEFPVSAKTTSETVKNP